jgi:two-component SAPR family response regulator
MNLAAQSTEQGLTMPPIPTIRQLSHEYILNSEQSLIQNPSIAKDTSTIQSIRLQIFENRKWIETNTALSDNEKFKWLRGINNLLFELHAGLKTNKINTAEVVNSLRAYTSAMQLSARGLTISQIITNENNTVANILLATGSFTDNIGYTAARDQLILNIR